MHRHAVLVALLGTAVASGTAAGQSARGGQLPVAARALPRGTVLGIGDIAWVDSLAPGGAARVIASAGSTVGPGWVTRRVIAAGEPLQVPAVAAPPDVRANQVVELVLRRDDVVLTLRGTASRDAAAGERVVVRVDARRRFEGVVEGPGRVRLM